MQLGWGSHSPTGLDLNTTVRMTLHTFSVWDFVVFGIVLAISASIGIYYGCSGKRQSTTQEFLMADRSMQVSIGLLFNMIHVSNPGNKYRLICICIREQDIHSM